MYLYTHTHTHNLVKGQAIKLLTSLLHYFPVAKIKGVEEGIWHTAHIRVFGFKSCVSSPFQFLANAYPGGTHILMTQVFGSLLLMWKTSTEFLDRGLSLTLLPVSVQVFSASFSFPDFQINNF